MFHEGECQVEQVMLLDKILQKQPPNINNSQNNQNQNCSPLHILQAFWLKEVILAGGVSNLLILMMSDEHLVKEIKTIGIP